MIGRHWWIVQTPASRTAAAATLALVLATVIAGCGSGAAPIARVGHEVITRDDFEAAARGNARQYAMLGDSARSVLLDDLVRRELMVEAAKQGGLYRDTTFLDFGRGLRDQVAREALFQQLSGGQIPVSEAEARAFYERRRVEALTKVIFVANESLARAALDELGHGVDFMEVAGRYNQRGMIPNGGDLGWIAPGSLMPVLDQQLIDAPLGRVVGPIVSRGQGWFLMRVDRRRGAEVPGFSQVRDQVMSALAQRKQRAYLLTQVDRLKQAWEVRVVPGGAATLVEHARSPSSRMLDSIGAVTALAPLPLADQTRLLATWRGGEYTLGDAWDALRKPNGQPPNFEMQPLVETWIEGQVIDRALLAEAAARRLTDEPDAARVLRERQNNYLLDAYYGRAVMQAIHISEDDVRAAFRSRPGAFPILTQARVNTLVLADTSTINTLAMHIGHASSLREAASALGLADVVTTRDLRFPTTDVMWQAMAVQLQRMREGEYAGPFPMPNGWMVLQLVSKTERPATWEELAPGTRQQIQNDVVARMRESRFMEVTDSLRRVIPVVIDGRALRKATWPDDMMLAPAPGSGG